jgi:hypothetical protein
MKSMGDLIRDWNGTNKRINMLMNDKLPRIIGNEAVRAVRQNFISQGYDSGIGKESWPARADKTNKAYDRRGILKGSVYRSGNPLLLQTRNLYNAVQYKIIGKLVIIGVDETLIPYAKRMNEGGGGVPPRKFMPEPDEPPNMKILKAIKKKYESELNNAMGGMKL